ncbi:Xaa-Pro peptidase family protein [Paenibacillus sp. N1-5-1-14]|uniref:M24 family metallopeptidase n=1 Tax=Paenibacillus radicibacter TaxID=2972488 RepID=UPI00215936D6|nr:Xaa-Pro peptidase family protein [Paenibacillus radicibacter]MCR8644737.1 Xaa-Pro peptidase family protein [Paenibacillus radicibacter]
MKVTESIYKKREQRLQAGMNNHGIDVFVVTQNIDLYYMTGSMQNGYLFVPAVGESVFMVRRSISRAEEESAFEVEVLGSLRTLQERLAARYPQVSAKSSAGVEIYSAAGLAASGGEEAPASADTASAGAALVLATELDVLPVATFRRLEAAILGAQWVDGSRLLRELRMIKSPDEIAAIRTSASAVDAALEAALRHVRPGMPEFELMAFIEHQLRLRQHAGIMRMRAYNAELVTGMVAAGSAAAEPTYFDGPGGGRGLSTASPQSSSQRPIGIGEPLLLDLGCCIDGYVIDQTRTAVFGELPEDLQHAYDVSVEIQKLAESSLKPGTICEQLYVDALQYAADAGLADHFMGYGDNQVKFLGHGIGLEMDELPVLAKGFPIPLQPGMVIAIEPKFTFPGRGVVGVEDSYLITEEGYEKLSISRSGVIQLPI